MYAPNIPEDFENKIIVIRGQQVMLDSDLAEFYEVSTKTLHHAVKRNKNRLPKEFMFRLTTKEKNELVTNCDRLASLKHSTFLPYAFTEYGVSALSGILKSERAIQISISIIRFLAKEKEGPDLFDLLTKVNLRVNI